MQTHILCLDVAHPFASVCSRNLLFTAFVPFLLVVVLFVAALWPANAKRALPEWTHGFAEFISEYQGAAEKFTWSPSSVRSSEILMDLAIQRTHSPRRYRRA